MCEVNTAKMGNFWIFWLITLLIYTDNSVREIHQLIHHDHSFQHHSHHLNTQLMLIKLDGYQLITQASVSNNYFKSYQLVIYRLCYEYAKPIKTKSIPSFYQLNYCQNVQKLQILLFFASYIASILKWPCHLLV